MTYRLELEYEASTALEALVLKDLLDETLSARLVSSRLLLEVGAQSVAESVAKRKLHWQSAGASDDA